LSTIGRYADHSISSGRPMVNHFSLQDARADTSLTWGFMRSSVCRDWHDACADTLLTLVFMWSSVCRDWQDASTDTSLTWVLRRYSVCQHIEYMKATLSSAHFWSSIKRSNFLKIKANYCNKSRVIIELFTAPQPRVLCCTCNIQY
jgi:ribosomal protein S27E